MSRGLEAARLVTAVAAVGLPLFHALLNYAAGRPAWPIFTAVAAGLLTRATAGAAPAVVTALALAPVWQALVSPFGVPADFEQIAPLVAFLSAALAWPGPGGWQNSGQWRVPVAAWALVLSLVAPVVAIRELDFSWQAASWPHLSGIALLGAGAQLVALLLFDWYHQASEHHRRLAWRALIPGTAAAALVALWQQQVDSAFLSRPFWASLERSAGTFFDANATAAWLALTAPVLASSWVRPASVPRALWRLACLGLALAAVAATGSQSALAALVGVVLLAAAGPGRWWHWSAGAAVLGLSLWAVITLVTPLEDPSVGHALGRLSYTLRRLLASEPDAIWQTVWDRGGYGPAAIAMIADRPWTGTGVGLFGSIVPGYASEALGWPLPADNAQNWWRHHIAELGVLGALPGLACSLLAVWALRHRGAATAPLAGLGLLALMSPPTPHPLLYVVAGLVVAHAAAAAPGAPPPATSGPQVLAVWTPALLCAVLSFVVGWQDLRPAFRAARFRHAYSYGVTAVGPTPYGEGRWMGRRGVAVVDPEGHRTLVARVVVPHEDAAAHPVRVVVSHRNGTACVHEAVDATPFECRMPVPPGQWPMVRVDISRAWRVDGGTTRAAVVNAHLED